MRDLEFFLMASGAYPYYPHKSAIGEYSRTAYISLPTSFYDHALAQRTLDAFVETIVLAEKLGYDGILHSEQHGGPISLTGNGLVATAYLAAHTERILLATVGPILNAYLSPVRLAEEIALVDMLSHGRLIVGLPMGIGGNYHAYGVANAAIARERFREAHELLIRCMTEPGPFEFQGEYFHVPYVNLWPRPVQQPHPPIWIPAAGSRETLQLCARHRYVYQAVLTPRAVLTRNCALFRELCAEEGYDPDARQVASVITVHTAETDRQARFEAESHVLWMFQNLFRSTFADSFPPGHVSPQSLRSMMAGGGYRSRDISDMSWEELCDEGWVVAGSPDTVADRIEELTSEVGAGRLIMMSDPGSMPDWMAKKSLTMFAEEVMPRFRAPGARPVWAREDLRTPGTAAELAAMTDGPRAAPLADLPGVGLVDTRTAHVHELRNRVDKDA